jgi:hypothetical protein
MNNKKYLAWFINPIDEKSFNKFVLVNNLLINKISEKFEKIYMVNVEKLKFFSKRKIKLNYRLNENLKFPSNIEFFNPTNPKDFNYFMVGKELIGINSFGRSFNELKIYFLLSRHKIKQVQTSNIGNIQSNLKVLKGFFWKGLLYKFKHDYSHKFTVLLSNFGLVPKMEIRFITNTDIIEYKKKGKGLWKKIFNYFNFHFAKEFILINSRAFDEIKESKIEIEENQIVLLDEHTDDPQWTNLGKVCSKEKIDEHYRYLTKLLNYLSNIYNKKVVVCIHPMDDLEKKRKYFPGFKVVKYQTRENIMKAFIVLFFESGAIIDAILLKKRIATLFSSCLDENQVQHGKNYSKKVGILQIDIEDEIKFDKDNFLLKLDKTKEKYSKYINEHIKPDGENIGHEKIIKILKERFFN